MVLKTECKSAIRDGFSLNKSENKDSLLINSLVDKVRNNDFQSFIDNSHDKRLN